MLEFSFFQRQNQRHRHSRKCVSETITDRHTTAEYRKTCTRGQGLTTTLTRASKITLSAKNKNTQIQQKVENTQRVQTSDEDFHVFVLGDPDRQQSLTNCSLGNTPHLSQTFYQKSCYNFFSNRTDK